MNDSELAQAMLDWKAAQQAADEIAEAIKAEIADREKGITVGDVRATYSAGRKRYDYQAACLEAPTSVVSKHTQKVVNWRAVAEELQVEDIPFEQGDPSVSLRIK